jgi:hypothetical protein
MMARETTIRCLITLLNRAHSIPSIEHRVAEGEGLFRSYFFCSDSLDGTLPTGAEQVLVPAFHTPPAF